MAMDDAGAARVAAAKAKAKAQRRIKRPKPTDTQEQARSEPANAPFALAAPHAETPAAVAAALAVDPARGLSAAEAAERLADVGPNRLDLEERIHWTRILLRQFTAPLILILFAAAALSAAIGEAADAATILAIVAANGALGFIQEARSEAALAALKRMLSPKAVALRDGARREVDAAELTPGDVVIVANGDQIPADLRLIAATELSVDESALTGESTPARKSIQTVAAEAALGDRAGMAFAGASVANGRGVGIVTATGLATELGRIARMTHSITRGATPLERKLGEVGLMLGAAAATICVSVALAGWALGRPFFEMLMTGVSLAVAAAPEGLPAVVTITLALGVGAMAKRNALLRHLKAAETLGAADVICTDKTGTLTRNEMAVTRIWTPDIEVTVGADGYAPEGGFETAEGAVDPRKRADLAALLTVARLCNNAEIRRRPDGGWDRIGEATEAALRALAMKAGAKTDVEKRVLAEFSFNSRRKRMTVIVEDSAGGATALVKGAPEVILARATRIQIGDDVMPLDAGRRAAVERAFMGYAERGMRALALASKPLRRAERYEADAVERDLILHGVVGIIDPPRPETPGAIAAARAAGLKVIMITGDAGPTAQAIAAEVGLAATRIVTGSELDRMDDQAVDRALADEAVFARVAPEHKVLLVRRLQHNGARVAMTGDGVNDAPALAKADVGVAMGMRGTDVARGAADVILLDDNFATIVAAIAEGRRQYANIRKFISYLLSSNLAEVIAICAALLIGGPLLLLPVQILWMNLVTDGPTALALGVDPEEPGSMTEPPRPRDEPLIDRWRLTVIGAIGLYIAAATLGLFFGLGAARGADPATLAHAQTMAFTAMVLMEKINVLNFRVMAPMRRGLGAQFRLGGNPWLWAAALGAIGLQFAAIYLPFFNDALSTTPLSLADWGLLLAVGAPVLAVGALTKRLAARRLA